MADMAILEQLINDSARVKLEDNFGKKKAVLTEPQNPETEVAIYDMPDNALVIKADRFRSPDSVFKGDKGECKRADYVMVADTGSKKVIICIEMARRSKPENEVVQQLKGARCFMAYCQEVGKAFWNKRDFMNGFEYRFVSIGQISINKGKTRIDRKQATHNQPEQMMKIGWPHHLEFNKLAGS